MKHKIFKILVFLVCLFATFFVASCQNGATTEVEDEIVFNTLVFDGTIANLTVSNGTTVFDFSEEITVNGDISYVLSSDKAGLKKYNSNRVSLQPGENIVFVITFLNEEIDTVYEINIYRKKLFSVTFKTNGGSWVAQQRVEEGNFASEPTTNKDGYNFAGWDYDFSLPITENITVTASWTPRTDISYVVKHYFQNVDDDGYTLLETEKLIGETESFVEADKKDIDGFVYNKSLSTPYDYISGNGKTTLSLYYDREEHDVTINWMDKGVLQQTKTVTYKYGAVLNLGDFLGLGYKFLSWSKNGEVITTQEDYVITVDENAVYTANVEIDENLSAFTFESTKTDCIITGLKDNSLQDIVIPDCVTEIGDKAFEHSGMNSIVIGKNVRVIGKRSFYCCNVPFIAIPNSVEIIKDYAFYMARMESIEFGNGLKVIGESAFSFTGMDSFELPNSVITIGKDAFRGCDAENIYLGEGVETIGDSAFTDCRDLKSIVIPDSVTEIGFWLFQNCFELTSVVIGNGLKIISRDTFASCYKLTSVQIGENVEVIGERAFAGCRALDTFVIPDNVTTICEGAFGSCKGLKSIEIGKGVTFIGERAFASSGLLSVVIPDNVTTLEEMAFHECPYLVTATIGEGITDLEAEIFSSCDSLTSIKLPNSLINIKSRAFMYCKAQIIWGGQSENCSYWGKRV